MASVHPPLHSSADSEAPFQPRTHAVSQSNVVVFDETINVEEDVTDFFDSHFKSREDLGNIKAILQQQADVGNELKQQLDASRARTAQVLKQAQITSKASLDNLQKLESSSLDLEEQMENSESFASGKNRNQRSLIDELSGLQARVQALEDAKRYILTVSRSQQLISQCKEQLQTSPEQALVPYKSLVELSRDVNIVVNQQDTKLDRFMSASVDGLLQEIKASLSLKFQASLDSIGWPKPTTKSTDIKDDQRDQFEEAYKEFLLLQEPAHGPLDHSGEKPFPPLLTTELMPEWYLTHVLELVRDHSAFLQNYVQEIVQETEYKEYDVKNDFIRLLLAAVERKIALSVLAMLSSPEILSHFIHEILKFDRTLREQELYQPPGQTTEWQGTVQVFLGNRAWLKTWLRVEKDFAVARYTQIVEDADAWRPAYEDIAEKDIIIPTKSAEMVMDLLEIITERYRPLPVLEHRTFLLDIQLDILIAYHRHIRDLVDQFESLTYSFVRVLPGAATTEELNTMGIEGLRNLCQWMASAEYISLTLKDWGEDVFFLELYKEISERTKKIKNPMLSENEESDDDNTQRAAAANKLDERGTIFDDSIRGFSQLSKRIQELIVKNVTKDVFGSMKPYVSLRSWPQIEFSAPQQPQSPILTQADYGPSSAESDDVSPELYQPLGLLAHSLEFLASALPTRQFTALYRQISLEMQDFIWQKIIMKNSFSELGGLQFARDVRVGLLGTGRRWIKRPENYHRKLRDASILLSLQSAKANSPPMVQERKNNGPEGPTYAKRTLAQIMAVVFDEDLSVEEVQKRLEEIGVTHLGVPQAKEVIRRR
ncbi:hypothetical protein BGZ83_010423, partial [Gryganskiella cystojenkinii]